MGGHLSHAVMAIVCLAVASKTYCLRVPTFRVLHPQLTVSLDRTRDALSQICVQPDNVLHIENTSVLVH